MSFPVVQCDVTHRCTRLLDRILEQVPGCGRKDVESNGPASSTLAYSSHLAGIASKGADVVPDPFQRQILVPQTLVAFNIRKFVRVQEAKSGNSMGEKDF